MKKFFVALLALISSTSVYAQMDFGGGGSGGGNMRGRMNAGHFYGKVVDSASGSSIPFAAVQLTGPKWDTVSQTMKNVTYSGQLTGFNGEFSLEKLPVAGPMFQPLQFTLQITAIGYKTYTTTVSFDISQFMKRSKKMQSNSNGDMSSQLSAAESMINIVDKDLGNIKLASSAQQLKTVTVNGEAPPMELKFDRKVFDVSKSITNAGGTAEDVLKNIPSVNVDIDGNVTLRNSSPTIYVDGMPSTLTIDQIPAEQIDKIEVITNPSAKFDAAASSGGIINIVLKHDKTAGYNGSVRAGIDSYGKPNGGLDFNMRQGKINVFASVFYHGVNHKVYGTEDRDYTAGQSPLTDVHEKDTNAMNGDFAFVRGGFDYFMDNRNTFTLSGTYGQGNFATNDFLHTETDTLHTSGPTTSSDQYRNSNSSRLFKNTGVQLSYKHLFPKEGRELTANGSFFSGGSNANSLFTTQYYDNNNNPYGPLITQKQTGNGTSNYGVVKTDFTDPLDARSKLEMGLQASMNQFTSQSNNYILNPLSNDYVSITALNTDYSFSEQVFAAYMTYSRDFSSRFSAQVGLRMESTLYNGQLADSTKYNYQYPASLFPSAYLTYHLTDKSDLQLNYSRHINRPGFMQVIPYLNYADSLNITQGNPNLQPEFVNSSELNFLHTFDKRNTFLFGAYYKYTTGLITTVSQEEFIPFLNRTDIVNTYENANSAYAYGLELTGQNSISDWLDVTTNVNFFESGINSENLANAMNNNNMLSWFAKLNLTFKLPKNFSMQLNGNYLSKTIINPNGGGGGYGGGGGGRWGGGGGGFGGVTPSAQGYILPNYYVDLGLKKDFLKNRKASITINMHDVFATSVSATTSTTAYYTQTTSRIRDQRLIRFTFSYRFGQQDFTLFKKKNMNFDAPPDTGGGEQ